MRYHRPYKKGQRTANDRPSAPGNAARRAAACNRPTPQTEGESASAMRWMAT